MGKGAVNFPAVMAKLREINAQIPNTTLPPLPPAPPSPASQPSLVDLFPRGSLDVECYFGPILYSLPQVAGDEDQGSSAETTLIALTEARLFSCNDGGPKRIAMRRSEDSGRTWSPIDFIWNDTTLPTLPSKTARWAQWNEMGGSNFTGSNFGSVYFDSASETLSLYFTFGKGGESTVDMLIIDSKV